MSKTTAALAGIVILSAAILTAWSMPQAEDPAVLLRAAIEREEVDGNLDAAIEQYKHIIKIAGASRAVAAQALLRLGGCYERRGPEEARRTYQQLIRDYGEQSKEVAAARQRLAALTAGAPARAGDSRLTIRRVPDLDMYAKPSPDGKYLAFVEWKAGNQAVLDVATGATRMLTKDGSFVEPVQMAQYSAWSRDSSRIAFQWDFMVLNDFREEVRIFSVDGNASPVVIAVPGGGTLMPRDWSPDGSRIVGTYQAGRGEEVSVALVGIGARSIDKLNLPPRSWLEYRFTEDGSGVLYSAPADGKAGPNDIFLYSLKTGVSTPVIQHPAEDLLVGILPGTEWLLFASDRQGRLDLLAVPFRRGKADGQPVVVKQGLGRFFPLGFTNHGQYYYATLSSTDDVFLADFDRATGRVIGEARKMTSKWDGFSGFPSFSPDGGSLAYLVKRSPLPIPTGLLDSLVVQSLMDPAAEPLVVGFEESGLDQVMGPCWLPDGKAIVVGASSTKGQGSALYRVDLPNLRKTRIYTAPAGRRLSGHVCASNEPVVYVDLATEVVRIGSTGDNEQRVFLAPQGQAITGMALSPDGRTLSFTHNLDNYRRALLVMPVRGGTPRQVLEFRQPTGGGVSLAWAPDGRSILYVVRSEQRTGSLSFELYSTRVDAAAASPELIYKWAGQFYWLSFHPDGRRLAFTGRTTYSTASEVWVMENLREELKVLTSAAKRP